MNYITIIELSELSGVPGNSVILYLSMFEEFFREHKIVEGIKQIPEEKVDLIRAIHDLYQNQKMTKQEILDKVRTQYPWEIPKETENDSSAELGTKIDLLTREMETLNTSGIASLVQAVERLTDIAKTLPEALTAMIRPSESSESETVLDQLLTTRQDDQDDDPELKKLIEKSKEDLVDNSSLTFESDDDEDKAGQPIEIESLFLDDMIDSVIDMQREGMTPSEIKAELRRRTGSS